MRASCLSLAAVLAVFMAACSGDTCEPDCSGRECGPDPICGEPCGTCGENATCEDGQCACDHVACGELCCAAGEICLMDFCAQDPCDPNPCTEAHKTWCLSDIYGLVICTCDPGYEDDGTGTCRPECCAGQAGFIEVSGAVTDLVRTPIAIDLAAWSQLDVIVGNGAPLAETRSDALGSFHFDCFDVSDAHIGLVLVADDAGDSYFPTATGVAAYGGASDKLCIDQTPPVWAVPGVLVDNLDAHPDIDSEEGLVLGFVVDAEGAPIQGAEVTQADGTPIDPIFYPDASFDMTASSTTVTGMYIIPGPFNIQTLTAEAQGETFPDDLYKAMSVAGLVYMCIIRAED
ncbi:MAG: carboxypeptidase regulatory-like domain-containing protein [Deltaproteobacteria bacterium]|nr:carboxypeptidase regulatory-like domain-containing protein [Deltaproteobacteria bacterium]